MADILKPVIDEIRSDEKVQAAWNSSENPLSSSLLNKTGDIFELWGASAARQFLLLKKESGDRSVRIAVDALLRVVDCLDRSEEVSATRSLGRMVIKTLRAMNDRNDDMHTRPSNGGTRR